MAMYFESQCYPIIVQQGNELVEDGGVWIVANSGGGEYSDWHQSVLKEIDTRHTKILNLLLET